MAEKFSGDIALIAEAEVSGWVLMTKPGDYYPVPTVRINGKNVGKTALIAERADAKTAFGRDTVAVDAKIARYLSNGHNTVEIIFDETGEILENGRNIVEFDLDKVVGEHRWNAKYLATGDRINFAMEFDPGDPFDLKFQERSFTRALRWS